MRGSGGGGCRAAVQKQNYDLVSLQLLQEILLIEPALAWPRGRQPSYIKDQVQDSPSGNVLGLSLLLAQVRFTSRRSYFTFLRESFRGISSTAPQLPAKVTSCLEVSVAKGYGSPPCGGLAPCGPGTEATQLTESAFSCVRAHSQFKIPLMFCGRHTRRGAQPSQRGYVTSEYQS